MVKNISADAGDTGSIPGTGRSPGGGNSNPLQYFSLEEPNRLKSMGSESTEHSRMQYRENNTCVFIYTHMYIRSSIKGYEFKLASRIPIQHYQVHSSVHPIHICNCSQIVTSLFPLILNLFAHFFVRNQFLTLPP